MKYLFVSRDTDSLAQLDQTWGRADLKGELLPSVESAFFAILQGSVAVVFLDLRQIDLDQKGAIEDMVSLEEDLEVVLIAHGDQIEKIPFSLLRHCFCVMDLPLFSRFKYRYPTTC